MDTYLSPLALAVWIRDDGSKGINGETYLHTRSHTLVRLRIEASKLYMVISHYRT